VKVHCGAPFVITKPTIMRKEIIKAKTINFYFPYELRQSVENGTTYDVGSGWAAC